MSSAARAAQYAVARAIRVGALIRQPCSRCAAIRGEAHHEDYSKPLDVIWLCRKCHRLRHRERGDFKRPWTNEAREAVILRLPPFHLRALATLANLYGKDRAEVLCAALYDYFAKHPQVRKAMGQEAA